MRRIHLHVSPFATLLTIPLALTLLLPAMPVRSDTQTVTKIGQGVYYKKTHYVSLYGAQRDVYVLDANLNDPEVKVKFPYRTGGAKATVSVFGAETPGAIGAVNGQFFSSSGSVQYLRVNNAVIATTQPNVQDQQGIAITGSGANGTAGISVIPRPFGGWDSLGGTPSVMTSGPDLINDGVRQTYPSDPFYQGRTARTCAGWTYDNHLIILSVDISSTSAGMSLPELSQTLQLFGNIKTAFNLDGGGSTTMWVTGTLVNRPSDGTQRAVADAVAVVSPPPVANRVGMARTPSGQGYWICSSDGYVFAFGDATYYGSMGGQPLNQPIVGMAARPQGDGYWLVARDGGIFCFGAAPFQGSMGGTPLNQPMIGMASTADGSGYWTVAKDGGIFSFNAPFHGSLGGQGYTDIVGMATSFNNNGYWILRAGGAIYTYGANYYGGGSSAANDFVGMAARSDGTGYWLVRNNGSIYSFGSVNYAGGANEPGNFIGIAPGPSTFNGYWLLKKDGSIYTYGDAPFKGAANY
jgi:ribosomal protein L24E